MLKKLAGLFVAAAAGVVALSGAADGQEVAGSAVKASIKKNVLTVTGTSGADAINLRLRAGDPNTLEVDVGANGTADFAFDRAKFNSIVVSGGGGADTLVADSSGGTFTGSEQTTLDGGDGPDTLRGEAGGETLRGGVGDDFIDGNLGTDTVVLGDGNDLVQWDPGDASDVVTGGVGIDRLLFNASNAGERLDLSAVGSGHVRLFRDIGSASLDLDDVEIVELRLFGGADTVSVTNLTGTDVTEVRTDLAAQGGGDDTQIDSVVVPKGVTVGTDGTAGVVDGLGARVRVLGGSATDRIHVTGAGPADVVTVAGTPAADTVNVVADGTDVGVFGATPGVYLRLTTVELLKVLLGAGDDSFSAVGNLASLVSMDVDGGDGADTVLGGNGADVLRGGNGDDFVDGQQGLDTLLLGDGNDVVQWDPGDSNDTIVGGAGSDRFQLNGTAINENMAVAAGVNGHAVVTRDIAAITLDLDEVEVVDLRTVGGPDTVTVSDLTGTDVTEVRADLALVGGGDDGQIDSVVVPQGVTVGTDGTAGVVDGLGARVRVLGGSATDRIHVTGAGPADVVTVAGTPATDSVNVVADGTDAGVFGATPGVYLRLTTVELLKVLLGAGDDSFSAVGNLASLVSMDVDGGDGADTILGGNGADVLRGGDGDDLVDGQQGLDTLLLGDGNDVVQWDPGDGNDTIVGGTGSDRLQFNGSNASENIDLSTIAGGHVRLSRDVAAIVLDIDDIEVIDVRLSGGADNLTVNSLLGTDVTEVRTDVAAFGGGDDTQIDSVVVPKGVTVGTDGTAGVVDGLGARVRVLGGSATDRIHVTGGGPADVVTVAGTPAADTVNVVADGTDVGVFGATPGVYLRLTTVELLKVLLGPGDDLFSAVGNLASLVSMDVDGGDGADSLLGGNGADVLRGGNGDDFVDGQQGLDTLLLGDGNDVVQWDPGDSNDTIVGGTGSDRLVFNGSNIGEKLSVSPGLGGHAVLTRDIAAITLDLDDLEVVDLRLSGGADTVTVNSLAGTDVTEVRTDVAAFGGGDDGQVDSIVVNGTTADDTIAVTHDGAAVSVQGLTATVRIAGAAPLADQLTVNGLAGNDNVSATPEANAAMLVTLVP